MNKIVYRVLFTLAASSGLVAASTLTAHAGINLSNHCEPRHHR
jgi:hypothetical protein